MFDDDDDEFDEFYMPDQEEFRLKMEQEAQKKFRAAAYQGYQHLVDKGMAAIDSQDKESAILAIQRILGLMESEEEYEKCAFLQNFLKNELNVEPHPIFDFQKV